MKPVIYVNNIFNFNFDIYFCILNYNFLYCIFLKKEEEFGIYRFSIFSPYEKTNYVMKK